MCTMRATPKRFIRSLFLISISGFFIINMNLFIRTGLESQPPDYVDNVQAIPGLPAPDNNHGNRTAVLPGPPFMGVNNVDIVDLIKGKLPPDRGVLGGFAISSNKTENVLPGPNEKAPSGRVEDKVNGSSSKLPVVPGPSKQERQAIMQIMLEANREQKIRNLDKFDLSASADTVVIVVQVHNRPDYLRHLLDSMRKARFIEQALVIFSHDYYSPELNKIVETVDFCPVLQIFYPFNMQLHPDEFPGADPGDCTRDMKREEAVKVRCNNADFPDKYGHYREAKVAQTKHHWFWKLNHVFDYLDVTRNFNGPVLLLEEDHYVVEDFMSVLWKMYRFKEQACRECGILTIGNYDKKPMYGNVAHKGIMQRLFGYDGKLMEKVDRVEILTWISSKHNMGMSLNREVWMTIKACAEAFCRFDDYNWDWSLQFVSHTCIPNKLKVMVAKSPRTYHIGECGVHHKGKNCNPYEKVRQIETLLLGNRQHLFPDTLAVHGYPRVPNRMPKPNGGWGDHRDHQLCMSFTDKNAHR